MYAILSGGTIIALCSKPRYVKRNENNVYIEADATDAIGVSVNGQLYNINGGNAIADAPEAVVVQRDIFEYVFNNRVKIKKNEETTGSAIIEMENALCELDIAADEKLIVLENALCEIDSMINGGGYDE